MMKGKNKMGKSFTEKIARSRYAIAKKQSKKLTASK